MSDKLSSRSPPTNGYKKARRGRRSSSRSRSYTDSRSRSGSHRRSYSRSYTRSRSRSSSFDRDRHRRRDYRDRSPHRGRPSRSSRNMGNPDEPMPCKCLGVFGLSLYTQERDLRDIFSKYGGVEDVVIVYDHATRRSRGFGFVYFDTVDDAAYAKEKCAGLEIDGRRIRVDFSVTQRAHTPTPGIYMGKPTYGPGYSRKRTPSPYYGRGRRSYSSRSRSYSPTKLLKIEDPFRNSINFSIKLEI